MVTWLTGFNILKQAFANVTGVEHWSGMEFIIIRVLLVCLFLYSTTKAVEEWSWQRDDRLELLDKRKSEGTLCVRE